MRLFKIVSLLMLLAIIVSCSNEHTPKESDEEETLEDELAGYVLHTEEKRFLMIDNEDEAVYKELENLTMEEMLQEDPDPPLVFVNYSNIDKLNKGDHIIVDYDGVMTFSIPGQINASKVTQIE